MKKFLILFLGFIAMTYGITYIILYINLFAIGYTIKEYLTFLFTRVEGYFLPLGILLELIGLNIGKDKIK